MQPFYQSVNEDFAKILEDEVEYFSKKVKVRIFESLDDPSLINKSGGRVPLYLLGNFTDFVGIQENQQLKIENKNYIIENFRTNIFGAIHIYVKEVKR